MSKGLKVFLLWFFNGAFLLASCGTLESVILQFSLKSLLHFAIFGLLWGLTSTLIVIGLYDAVSHNKEPEKTTRQILIDMLWDGAFIDCYLATHPIGEPDKVIYQPYMFFTDNKFSQDELTEIMKTIHQKFILNKETGYMEVDFCDLSRQLNKHGICHFITMRRYYFDAETNRSPESLGEEKETNFDEEKYLKHLSDNIFTVKYKERSTGRTFEINPLIDDQFYDTLYRNAFRSGEYILISGELPDKWK